MRIIDPYVEVQPFDGQILVKNLERYARTAYKSEGNITEESYQPFLQRIIKSGHTSTLEHEKVTVKFVCDRGITHEIVRHRIGSYTQESTRYCNYANEKFGSEITVIRPFFFGDTIVSSQPMTKLHYWIHAMESAEDYYFYLLKHGASPQEARSVLPNSLKTEIVVTYNLREWRHFFTLRCAKDAHPQMRQLAIPLLLYFKEQLPPLFDDIDYDCGFNAENYAEVKEAING